MAAELADTIKRFRLSLLVGRSSNFVPALSEEYHLTAQEERDREKAARHTDDNSDEELHLIGDDEIEAMRREAEEEERNERQAEVTHPPAAYSAIL